jgi:hypothetical protein
VATELDARASERRHCANLDRTPQDHTPSYLLHKATVW